MNWQTNLKERNTLKWSDRLKPFDESHIHPHLLIEAPCDLGVMRNGGKRGAKHGPQAITSVLKKMVPLSTDSTAITALSTGVSLEEEIEHFPSVQQRETDLIKGSLPDHLKKIAHLGGGHDHIYPLINAFLERYPKEEVLILNIDAHLDTRADEQTHSGTPFRQLFKKFGKRLHLVQIGIHSFANHPTNFEDMGEMEVLHWHESDTLKKSLKVILSQHSDKTLCLSLDCDGLDGSYMSAVSAPNHRGLSQDQFWSVFKSCQEFWHQSEHPALYGVYEFNPLFDDLSTRAARFVASSLFDFYE